MPSFGLPSARAEASRRNGAKSRGPKTPEGKARSAQNALKHGLRAQKHVVLASEDAVEFAELEAVLIEEFAPEGALQGVLVHRIACATWRLDRADRLEVEVFAHQSYGNAGLGLALIRDGNGTRSVETLMRYRGAAMAELMRALKALQAEARARAAAGAEVLAPAPPPPAIAATPARETNPDEPKSRANACELGESGEPGQTCERADSITARRDDPSPAGLSLPWPLPDRPARHARPIEPEFQPPCGLRPAAP